MRIICNRIDKENSQVGEVSSIMETQSTIPVIEIDTNKCLRPVICDLRAKLKPLIEHVRIF